MDIGVKDQNSILEQAKKDLLEGKKNPLINIDYNYVAPPPEKSLIEKNRFVLIRHGVTEFNTAFSDVVAKYGFDSDEFRRFKSDPRYIDVHLRREGINQCERSQKYANEINFRYVIVS